MAKATLSTDVPAKSQTHGLVVPTETMPIVKIENVQELIKLLSTVKIDSAEKAAVLFQAAKNASEFMRHGTQQSVNKDYAAELPAYNAGQDVNGVMLSRSVNTRSRYEKITKAMDWAIQAAQDLRGIESKA